MSFTFENQGTTTFLVYAVTPEDTIDTMSLGMLTNNKILGLAPTHFMQMDDTKYIKYNVTAHISVKQFFAGAVNKKRLIGVFKGIVNAMLSAEEYMIDTNSILLDLDYIFADVSTCETVLVCLPITEVEQNPVDLGMFFKNIVFSTQFDQTENCDYVAKIINYLNSTPVFSLTDFKAILDGLDTATIAGNPAGGMRPQPVVTPPVPEKSAEPQVVPVQQPVQQISAQPQPTPKPAPAPVQKPVAASPHSQGVPVPPSGRNVAPSPVRPPQGGMAIPGQGAAVSPASATPEVPADTGEKMSWFYLMQHYNKENAAIYKAQQDAEKARKSGKQAAPQAGPAVSPGRTAVPPAAPPAAPGKMPPVQKPTPGKMPVPPQNRGVAIPGQPAPVPGPGVAPVSHVKPTPAAQPAVQKPVQQPIQPPVQQPVQQVQPSYQPPVAPQGQGMNFGETTVLNSGSGKIGETTVLGGAASPAQPSPYLIRPKNNERIALNKPVFRIGKEKSYVDYFIGDNTAISRSHANIITREGSYFVVDTNSTNHTYVNGAMIQSNVEVQISHGDRIRLANEDFEFKLF